MDLLLDTHIWIWSEIAPERLPSTVAAALVAPDNRLWLSPISVWEMSRLAQRNRVHFEMPWPEWLQLCRQRTHYSEAAISIAVVEAARAIVLSHRDPMDWLLAATARYYGLTLVTADAHLLAGSGFATLQPQ